MAAAARCMRSMLRNSSNINSSSKLLVRSLNGANSAKAVTSVSLRSSLKETGLLNSSRNYSLVSKANFTNNIRPVAALCNLSTIPLINIDTAGAAADGVDSTGDDDAETWSQNSEDGYIGDDT